ncbi:bifunctional SulP family inorganic anion transporter/carbonic anhydrase [Vitiosangium sp. GDMCC 1.1324]|uniref:SulP family inorganic anion transporter n=1 Tax=Vitiosangium sp. (strain GDMCC 1.1324) TaxID=2138576 RepID=UPI000D3BD056|nr:bifunctional SulP family inorganic anion transporter/carbonic anhydrase [Vitiosangium sp. GDMCC 1.1324]PTL82351.1 sulfate permease [Vitiosangium sp. GDMCC 1.1324]
MNPSSVTRLRPRSSSLRLDLGLRRLLPEWKALLSPRYLKEDVLAGLTVACIAIPLSLAIALASGVPPEVGLVTAIIAGIVCALFGGTPLSVSGPAAAMAVLIASAVQQHGLGGLLVIGLVVGLLQVLTGVLGLGRLIRFVPVPVVAGFTAGIGAIILIGQLPRALGLPPPEQSHVLDVLSHVGRLLHAARPVPLALTLLTLAIVLGLPRVLPRLPAPLIAVIVPTVLCVALKLDVPALGELPRSLPPPRLPALPGSGWDALLGTALIVYALASLETLLSSGAVDKLARGKRHDPDQELVGQGLGNMAVSLFGGIPVTGVIARSALNVQAGARTRRSAIFHALVLLAAVFLFAPVMGRIPIAALAGVLLSVALRMLHPRELIALWKLSRPEAAVYAVTFVAIVLVDLIVGVQAGLVAALAISAVRMGGTRASVLRLESHGPHRFLLGGPISFLSSAKLERLGSEARELDTSRGVIIDLSGVTAMDASGAEMFLGLVEGLRERGARVALLGSRSEVRELLLRQRGGQELLPLLVVTESDAALLLEGAVPVSSHERLVHGVERFRQEQRERYEPLFNRLADGQKPHTLFITCADSRINPNLITSTEPGELFVVRNIGNLIPRASSPMAAAVGSALEYAVGVLGVTEVVVCGHSGCGAMRVLLGGDVPNELRGVRRWLEEARALLGTLPVDCSPEEAARHNALMQLDNALSYPVLRQKVEAGEVRLHAWFYDVGSAELLEWDAHSGAYGPLGRGARPEPGAAHLPGGTPGIHPLPDDSGPY